MVWLFEGEEERVVGFILGLLGLLLDLRIRERHNWNPLDALIILTVSLFLEVSVRSLHDFLFSLLDIQGVLNFNILLCRPHINFNLTLPHFLHFIHPNDHTLVITSLIPLLKWCCPHILLPILQQHLDKQQIFAFQLLIHPRLILLSHAIDDLRYRVPVLLHLLMMAPALIGISCDDHIGHHIIDLYTLFLDWVKEEVMEVGEEDGIFQSLFLVPMPIPLIF